ncbi:hypothetical protein K3X13_05460 [Aliiroseovarius crassostreae]|uniref:TadE/TadG family type IV pilus assembly protein n=1 Tax=Aliiroseovarius crassostreae TaxID=154981 RepID=UPI002205A31F|nr:TadE/TadG family type IV pilus assembly protein [Aliiroseovarius crassostreae]UWP93275.1 hypothetical protein K3X13_05460 [Aliiroseovarius crassostreae]
MMRFAEWKTRKTRIGSKLVDQFLRFQREEDGALVVFMLFMIVGMLIIAGLGVDFMHYEAQRTRLQATLDRAILAGAHPDQTTDRAAVVKSYFDSAGLGNYIDPADIVVDASATHSEVSAKAKMHVEPLLLQLIDFKGLDAVAVSGARQAVKHLEVSLVVDVSGSMGDPSASGNTKLYELKQAAKKFSNQLLCNPEDTSTSTNCTYTEKNTSISLVPYASQVSVGKDLLKRYNLLDQQDDSHCATFMDGDFSIAGIDPSSPLRQAAKYYGLTYRSWVDPNGWVEPSGAAATSKDTWWSCFTAPWREIAPLEDSAEDLVQDIEALDALGGTAIHIGMKWGVALLMKDANSVVQGLIDDNIVYSGFASRPYDPSIVETSKIVVLMTDGLNSSYRRLKDGRRTGPSPFWRNNSQSYDNLSHQSIMSIYDAKTGLYHWRNVPASAPRTADHPYGSGSYRACETRYSWSSGYYNYCWDQDEPGSAVQLRYEEFWKAGFTTKYFDQFSFLSTPRTSLSNADPDKAVDQLLLDQCDAAKTQGIKVYTIELETAGGSDGGSVLQRCSSGAGYYFKVDGSGLEQAFSAIGQDISRLRLTQ